MNIYPIIYQKNITNDLYFDYLYRMSGGIVNMDKIDTELEMKVDGKNIVMNSFVNKITSNIIVGILSSLHDIDDWKNASITIKRKQLQT